MKLNDMFKGDCFDTIDYVYDSVVTIDCKNGDDLDCDLLKKLLVEKVEVVKIVGDVIFAGYSYFIDKNFSLFKTFAIENWGEERLVDDEDLVYEFINQFHFLLGGSGTEKDYKNYVELLKKCVD